MKLYTFSAAPNPRRVGLLLKYKGINVDTQEVDLMSKAQFSESFCAINPRSTLPTLVLDDGTVLSDTIAICVYLDAMYPERGLFGSNDVERAQVIGRCHQIFFEGFAAVADVLRNQGDAFKDRPLPGPLPMPQIPQLVERGNLRIGAFVETMNSELTGREFLVGSSLSQADIDLYVVLGFCGWVKRKIPDTCLVLQAWFASMKARFGE
ncbi:MAG: glutathione S-transferase family protein [Zhongshania sp.]|uniref:glutathione S-transferase family protein n=1 Tax=Zhongshania sp. TaxID=1971902 RepID=UPI002619EC5A|nr:glutathione S-transferase family protein [Zhongshania sp.]MDF1692029.1 glutathione S-transferase family protein [Zhongshania sp.]